MSEPTDPLSAAIADAAITMPDAHLRVLADRIETHAQPETAWGITREPPVREYTAAAERILTAWSRTIPPPHGAAVASALRAASATRDAMTAAQHVELAWTGPDSTAIRAKPTSSVVTDLIGSARRSLLLVSFASRRVQPVIDALQRANARGVRISLLLENPDAAEGQYRGAAADPFPGIDATVYEWATNTRPRIAGVPAVMHAKIVLADDHTAFITSANLTGRALDHNMEAGALITGGPIPKTLDQHFRQLAYEGLIIPSA